MSARLSSPRLACRRGVARRRRHRRHRRHTPPLPSLSLGTQEASDKALWLCGSGGLSPLGAAAAKGRSGGICGSGLRNRQLRNNHSLAHFSARLAGPMCSHRVPFMLPPALPSPLWSFGLQATEAADRGGHSELLCAAAPRMLEAFLSPASYLAPRTGGQSLARRGVLTEVNSSGTRGPGVSRSRAKMFELRGGGRRREEAAKNSTSGGVEPPTLCVTLRVLSIRSNQLS